MKLTRMQLRKQIKFLFCNNPDEAMNNILELISDLELIRDFDEVDTELEEAKKRFPVGSWFTHTAWGDTLFKVKELKRIDGIIRIDDGTQALASLALCTPATLPPAKWRCMKTDIVEKLEDRLIRLDNLYEIGWYHSVKKGWYVRGSYIDISCYETALWLEIPRGSDD